MTQAPAEVVGVEMPKAPGKTYTWQDFTLEEHMRAFIYTRLAEKPSNFHFKSVQIAKDTYRINVVKIPNKFIEPAVMVVSTVIKVVKTPKGYQFVDIKA